MSDVGGPRTGSLGGVDAVTLIGALPVVGYVALFPYAAALQVFLGPNAAPVLLLGVPELLLGLVWVGAFRGERAALGRWRPSRLWDVAGLVLGGTVVLAPLVSIAYFRRRRSQTGHPTVGWLGFLRARLPGGGADAEQHRPRP